VKERKVSVPRKTIGNYSKMTNSNWELTEFVNG
jgi:hypothetical protein